MEYGVGPHIRGDLASTRREVAVFLDGLRVQNSRGSKDRQNWIARWTKTANAHSLLADLNIKNRAFDEATEAWLCALTALEVARRLADGCDAQGKDISAKVAATIQRFALHLEEKIERVQIACCDETEFLGSYLPAGGTDSSLPAVICISSEHETAATLLGRLLPVVIGRGMSLLVVSHEDVANHSRCQSKMVLWSCFEFLSARADVDATRIGVYGDGLSASLATDFAAFDRRLAAAVCDGGLWNWTRTLASNRWLTRTVDAAAQEQLASMRRSQLARQFRCPALVVAGERGIVSVSEAIKLQADCIAARIDLDLVVPTMICTQGEEVENFVTSDDRIFRWLHRKLARASAA